MTKKYDIEYFNLLLVKKRLEDPDRYRNAQPVDLLVERINNRVIIDCQEVKWEDFSDHLVPGNRHADILTTERFLWKFIRRIDKDLNKVAVLYAIEKDYSGKNGCKPSTYNYLYSLSELMQYIFQQKDTSMLEKSIEQQIQSMLQPQPQKAKEKSKEKKSIKSEPTPPMSVPIPVLEKKYDTSFFKTSSFISEDSCMEKLQEILNSSTKKSRVCEKLYNYEGRLYFNLIFVPAHEALRLLKQFPGKVDLKITDIEKARAKYRKEVDDEEIIRYKEYMKRIGDVNQD